MVLLALRQLQQARDNLRVALRDSPRDRDFPETLAAVRDADVVTMVELAEWTGLSRTRLYELLEQADREREP